jgi:hypothetical protein
MKQHPQQEAPLPKTEEQAAAPAEPEPAADARKGAPAKKTTAKKATAKKSS